MKLRVGRFYPNPVVKDGVDPFPPQRVERRRDRLAGCQPGIGDDHDPTPAEACHIGADFARRARSELDRRGVHGETCFMDWVWLSHGISLSILTLGPAGDAGVMGSSPVQSSP